MAVEAAPLVDGHEGVLRGLGVVGLVHDDVELGHLSARLVAYGAVLGDGLHDLVDLRVPADLGQLGVDAVVLVRVLVAIDTAVGVFILP
jgi:hypothetical protein